MDALHKLIAEKAPHQFLERDGRLFARFDRIVLFKHVDPALGNIAQYQLLGGVVINHKLPDELDLGGGEITLDEIEGLMPLDPEVDNQ